MTAAHSDGQASATGEPYRALLAVSEAIASHRDLPALFHELAGRLHQVVRFDSLALVLHEAATNTMRLHVLEVLRTHPVPRPRSFFLLKMTRRGWCGRSSNRSSSRAWRRRAAGRGFWNECSRMDSRVSAGFRLTTARRRLGTLVFASRQPAVYDAADVGFLQLVANQVAVAVENALAFQEIEAAFRRSRRSRTSSPRRMPTWRRRSAPSTTSARSSERAPPCAEC